MEDLTAAMKKISPKRKASTKLAYNSTFSAKPKVKVPNVTHNRGYWKRQADKWFSEFIRLRDSDERGMVTCVTCSHRNHWRQLQNGHWITRGHEATRYDERNCSCQCRGCNYNGGQHLKHAIIKAGKPVDTFVVTGLETDSMRTIDTDRRPRSTGAVLQLAGEVDTNVLSGAIRVVLDMREDTKWKRSSRLLPKRTFFDFLDNEPSVRDSVRFAQNLHSLKKLAGPTVPAGLYHMFSSVAKKEAQKFFNDLNDGLNLSPRDPAYLLRQRLIDNSASRSKLERTVVMALFTKAWNARLRGDEMRQLKWNPAVEEFPEVSREVAVA